MFFRVRCVVAQCLGYVGAPFSIAIFAVIGAIGSGMGLGHMLSQDRIVQRQIPAASTASVVLQSNEEWLSEKSWKRRLKGRRTSSSDRRSNPFDSTDQETQPRERSRARASGTYRTVCVRLCDGYYFPISFSTVKSRLAADDNACQSRCSSESRLFYYNASEGSPDTMVDRAGRPYADLNTAFLYRTKFEPSCQCKPDPWSKQAKQRHAEYRTKGWKRKAIQLARAERKSRSKSCPLEYKKKYVASNGGWGDALPTSKPKRLSGRMSLGVRSSRPTKRSPRRVAKRRNRAWKKNVFYSGND